MNFQKSVWLWLAEGLEALGGPHLVPSGYAVPWLVMALLGNLEGCGSNMEMSLEHLIVRAPRGSRS